MRHRPLATPGSPRSRPRPTEPTRLGRSRLCGILSILLLLSPAALAPAGRAAVAAAAAVVPAVTAVPGARPAVAAALAPVAPAKSAPLPRPSAADPPRQGGDTIFDAVPVATLPYADSGTTEGFGDDYSEMCPYGLYGPDVVYVYTPPEPMVLTVDLCGSSYDTAILVYDEDLHLLGCNDDFYAGPPCGAHVSYLALPVAAGTMCYIVVDAYGGDSGPYELALDRLPPCELTCPAGAMPEGEPPLADGYVDLHNGGCNTPGLEPFQTITAPLFCGRGGWYLGAGGANWRDTDWFLVAIPAGGMLEVTADAEARCWLGELGPRDCDASVGFVQRVDVGRCVPATLTVAGTPGELVWLWMGAVSYVPPADFTDNEFDYVLELNLDAVAAERTTWSAVRELYR